MLVLGIEGTAHTCGVGIIEADPGEAGRCRVRANEVDMLRPAAGGIHPREAAEHHAQVLPGLVAKALDRAGVGGDELGAVAFSQGPGLGPCLRTVATAARALALSRGIPLMGVNHCVAHLEIARVLTPAEDPVMLYASGANTQVIGEGRGRYRVFGETLDIGIGNALDKFAREQGIPFPGGPRIEELALKGREIREREGLPLPSLPYSVKGMDVAFSGLVTAADALTRKGVPLEVVCEALQEWAFSPIVEVTERALAHTGKSSVVLGGGVGRNRRLQGMLQQMAREREAEAYWPEPALLSDNGAMIAWNGFLLLDSGHPIPIEQSTVRQRFRTDEVPLVWRSGQKDADRANSHSTLRRHDGIFVDNYREAGRALGAEAIVRPVQFLGERAVLKKRIPKGYRHPRLEALVMARRTHQEARFLVTAREAGVRVPELYDAHPEEGALVMEEIQGPSLKVHLEGPAGIGQKLALVSKLGKSVATLHARGVVHGDLTTSNVLTDHEGPEALPVLIDYGLAAARTDPEAQAVDLHVFQEALLATHHDHEALWHAFVEGYMSEMEPDAGQAASSQLRDLESRGRYRSIVA